MSELNLNPEFTVEPVEGATEVAQPETVETATQSETPTDQAIPEEKPVVSEKTDAPDNTAILSQIKGLEAEKIKLLDEIKGLRGTKREIKQEELNRVDDKIEDLKDVNPEDVSLIEKVMRAKGMMTKAEVEQMTFNAVKTDELNKFLEKYPEYKPENDPNDINWNALQREFGLYRTPSDPRLIGQLLERAHKATAKVPSDRDLPARQQQLKTASVGGGSSQRSPSRRSPNNPRLAELIKNGAMQGWSDEELSNLEQKI